MKGVKTELSEKKIEQIKNRMRGYPGFEKVESVQNDFEDMISNLDSKVSKVLEKTEYDYLKGYQMYVNKRENDMKDLIDVFNEKNSKQTLKEDKI